MGSLKRAGQLHLCEFVVLCGAACTCFPAGDGGAGRMRRYGLLRLWDCAVCPEVTSVRPGLLSAAGEVVEAGACLRQGRLDGIVQWEVSSLHVHCWAIVVQYEVVGWCTSWPRLRPFLALFFVLYLQHVHVFVCVEGVPAQLRAVQRAERGMNLSCVHFPITRGVISPYPAGNAGFIAAPLFGMPSSKVPMPRVSTVLSSAIIVPGQL